MPAAGQKWTRRKKKSRRRYNGDMSDTPSADLLARHRADCRSVEREQADARFDAPDHEPTPAESAALVDELRCVLDPLSPVQRRIVELRLQGHDPDEIARTVRRCTRTVRRTLTAFGAELERRLNGPEEPPAGPTAGSLPMIDYADVVLLRQLGQGGMGKVYRARRGDGYVAVKLLRKPLRQHATATERFLHEAELLARLRHPGIVAIHALGRLPDGGHFLVTDLIDGSDLARRMTAGPVASAQAITWVAEAADAIEYAHRQGVIHCDLKPSNLLLDADGRIHVT